MTNTPLIRDWPQSTEPVAFHLPGCPAKRTEDVLAIREENGRAVAEVPVTRCLDCGAQAVHEERPLITEEAHR